MKTVIGIIRIKRKLKGILLKQERIELNKKLLSLQMKLMYNDNFFINIIKHFI